MAEVSLDFLAEQQKKILAELAADREDTRSMRRDMDMLIRLTTRVDHTLDALREDMRDLWLSQGDLRRRIEALEQ